MRPVFGIAMILGILGLCGGTAISRGLAGEVDKLLPMEKLAGDKTWVDPAIKGKNPRVVIWFDEQFLGDEKAYPRRAKEFAKVRRADLRGALVKTLKAQNEKSFQSAKDALDKLAAANDISNLERHWIVNGFSCNATPEGLKGLEAVKNIRAIFASEPIFKGKEGRKAEIIESVKEERFDPKRYKHPWYTRNLLADKAWQKFGVTGKGTLNVVHDFNFVFSDNVNANLYRNPKEIPGNGKDDDGNGLVDDYHGYNFGNKSASLTLVPVAPAGVNPQAMHGYMCAAIICGRGVPGAEHEFGIAPEGKWAGVIANGRVEAAVEWAIEQGADTYSMSFSRPNLGEYRSHWRKVMEHGALCGICFVTGAGNFALTQKVPVQMRVPEDIPQAVFAATGVQRDFSRTPFSSMGPVHWDTHHYKDGTVNKPEVCAFNMGLPILKRDGTVVPVAINGNSFAGPMTGGAIALILSADPDLNPWEVREILTSTATDVAKKGFDFETGHGLINCYRAVKEALRRKAIREGKDPKAYEGREEGDSIDADAAKKNLQARFTVGKVQPGGQADRLGLKTGDVILSYNGMPITTQESMQAAKNKAEDAKLEKIAVIIQRETAMLTVQFTPGPLGVVPVIAYGEPVFK